MSEPFEVGSAVVRIRVIADDVQQALSRAVNAVQTVGKTGQQVNQALQQTTQRTREMAQAAQQSVAAAAQVGADTGNLDKYAAKLQKLNAQYDLQDKKVLKLRSDLVSIMQQYEDLENAVGRDGASLFPEDVAPDLVNKIDLEVAKLDELRNSIRLTEQARDDSAAKAQASAERAAAAQEQLNQKLADKRAVSNTKVGMNTAAAAIRTVSNAAGGAVGNIGYLASEIIYLKEQMHLAQSGAASMAVGIAGGMMMAVTLITSIASQIAKAKAQELQAAKDAAAAYRAVNEETETAKRNIAVLQDQNSTSDKIRDAKEALAQQFPELVAGWDDEGNAILANSEAIKGQIDYLDKLDKAQQASASATLGTNMDDWTKKIEKSQKALRYVTQDQSITQDVGDYFSIYGFKALYDYKTLDEINADAKVMQEEIIKDMSSIKSGVTAAINEQTGGSEVSAAMSGYIDQILQDIADGGTPPEDIAQAVIDKYNEAFAKIPPEIQGMIGNLGDQLQPAYTSLFQRLQDGEIDMESFSTAIGTLSSEELQPTIKNFENLGDKIKNFTATDADVEKYNEILHRLHVTGKLDEDTFRSMSDAALISAEQLRQNAIDTKAASSSYLDAAKSVSELYNGMKSLKSDLSDIGSLEAARKALQAGKDSKDYAAALEYLSKEYGVTKEEAAGMAGQLSEEISLKKTLAEASIIQAQVEANTQKAVVEAMVKQGTITQTQADTMIGALKGVISTYDELMDKTTGGLDESQIKVALPKETIETSANEALNQQLQLLSRRKAMDDLTYGEEIAWYKKIRSQYAKTNDEKADLDEKLYTARKQQETAWVTYLKAMDQMTLQEEIDHVKTQMQNYREGVEERRNLETELHQLQISQAQSELETKKAYDQLTLKEEMSMLRQQLNLYKENTEARKKLEQELYRLRIQLMDSELEYQKNIGKLTARQELGELYQRLRSYKKGTEAYKELHAQIFEMESEVLQSERDHLKAMENLTLEAEAKMIESQMRLYNQKTEGYNQLEEQLYQVRQQIRERDAQNIDAVADGVMEALRNKYEQQLKDEEDRLDESAKAWEAWGKEQTDIIDDQIKALDKLSESEDRADEEAKKLRKIAMLEQQMQYEQDDYNKAQLKKQLDAAKEELAKWRKEKDREDAKSDLEEAKDDVSDRVEEEKKALEKQREEIQKEYDELLKEKNIQAEAEKLLLSNNQQEIIQLLKDYAPEYETVGQTLGEKLAEGFKNTIGTSITNWFEGLTGQIQAYQAEMAKTATAAADGFWAGREDGSSGPKTEKPPEIVQNITLHFNQPIKTPVELTRDLKRTFEEVVRLL